MENVLSLQLMKTAEVSTNADMAGSVASLGCDKPD
jgi:hypothetical protein